MAVMFSLWTVRVGAQSNLTIRLGDPDLNEFPTISAFLDVHDDQGNFVHNISREQVTVLEDGKPSEIEKIEEVHAGVQAVIAINPGASFAIRNFQAVSRYDLVKDHLKTWAKSRAGTTTDDWSLVITDGSTLSHTTDPLQFLNGLEADQVDPRTSLASIDTLAHAIKLAADPTQHPGMGKAVFFITSAIEGDIGQAIKDISDQALAEGIKISVWNVGSSGALITQSTQNLMTLASSTGGQVFNFSGEETLPDPEQYLDAVRHVYQITYQSHVGISGEHELVVQVKIGEEAAASNFQVFQVELKPPEPAFISPPITIERQFGDGETVTKESVISDGANPADIVNTARDQSSGCLRFSRWPKTRIVKQCLDC